MPGLEFNLEVCADSIESALIAQEAGAYRVEFCKALSEGGLTPSYGQIERLRENLNIKFYVLIRPRGGDFLYSTYEVESMKKDIEICGELGCDGVVIGILNADGSIDKKQSAHLIDIANRYGMGVTFHRAFDRTADIFKALEDVIELGCERILTSGGKETAVEGLDNLEKLVQIAGNRINIMPGAEITPQNAREILEKTKAKDIHGTFRSFYDSSMIYRNTAFKNQNEEYGYYRADADKIKAILSLKN